MKPGIIISSRLGSSRIPAKCLAELNGIPMIKHLVARCIQTQLPVVVACPENEYKHYRSILGESIAIFGGNEQDPMRRMYDCAIKYDFDPAIRVCHDKIFIDSDIMEEACKEWKQIKPKYMSLPNMPKGSGFEFNDRKTLGLACERFNNVEHITYAMQLVAQTRHRSAVGGRFIPYLDCRLLVDYPEDLVLLELVLSTLGSDVRLIDALEFLNRNPWAKQINSLPDVTIYTVAHNSELFIERAMQSVMRQDIENIKVEYLLIDDGSQDNTFYHMVHFSRSIPVEKQNNITVKVVRGTKNHGLASRSNQALKLCTAKNIIRLDSDDYFCQSAAIGKMLSHLRLSGKDAIYPSYYDGSYLKLVRGDDQHHVGGAMFNTAALNHFKFTDGLRGYEGLDFFERSKMFLDIDYISEPVFFYTHRDGSMSRTNLEEREEIKQNILSSDISGAV